MPIKPILSTSIITKSSRSNRFVASILDTKGILLLTSGRAAIALALKELGIGQGDKIFVPAFHCSSMVEPVIWCGAEPVFYRIKEDCSVDVEDLLAKYNDTIKAMIVTHYFGFPQSMEPIIQFSREHKVSVIEDCAHAFYGKSGDKSIGSQGDFAIASPMKFFPIFDGGLLASQKHDLSNIRTISGGRGFQIKSLLNNIEYSLEYGRLGLVKPLLDAMFYLKDVLWSQMKNRGMAKTGTSRPGASDGAYGFDPKWINVRMSYISRWILKRSPFSLHVEKRRENYLKMHNAWSGLPGVEPLFPEFPDFVIPYVYPLVVDNANAIFPALKQEGVPILRFGEFLWQGVDESVCPVSAHYSKTVLQFPCHQSLTTKELDWIIHCVSKSVHNNQ